MNLEKELYINQLIPKTIQGEGDRVGYPSTLIRLSGCNLRCKWCDTKYSWKFTEDDEVVNENNFNEFVGKIKYYYMKNIMITGGEPFIYSKNELFWKLLKTFERKIEIETNGSLIDNEVIEKLKENFSGKLNISPKLDQNFYQDKSQFENLVCNINNVCQAFSNKHIIKFVYSKQDFGRIFGFIDQIRNVREKNIYLMPLTPDINKYETINDWMLDYQKSMRETSRICLRYNLKFCARLHYFVFGNDVDEKI